MTTKPVGRPVTKEPPVKPEFLTMDVSSGESIGDASRRATRTPTMTERSLNSPKSTKQPWTPNVATILDEMPQALPSIPTNRAD